MYQEPKQASEAELAVISPATAVLVFGIISCIGFGGAGWYFSIFAIMKIVAGSLVVCPCGLCIDGAGRTAPSAAGIYMGVAVMAIICGVVDLISVIVYGIYAGALSSAAASGSATVAINGVTYTNIGVIVAITWISLIVAVISMCFTFFLAKRSLTARNEVVSSNPYLSGAAPPTTYGTAQAAQPTAPVQVAKPVV